MGFQDTGRILSFDNNRIKLESKEFFNKIYYFLNFEEEQIRYWNLRRGEIISIEDSNGKYYRARVVESESGQKGIYTFWLHFCLS